MACSLNFQKFLHYILTKFIKIFTLPLDFEDPLKGQPPCRPKISQPPLTQNFQKLPDHTAAMEGKNYDESCNRVKLHESCDIQERVVIKLWGRGVKISSLLFLSFYICHRTIFPGFKKWSMAYQLAIEGQLLESKYIKIQSSDQVFLL